MFYIMMKIKLLQSWGALQVGGGGIDSWSGGWLPKPHTEPHTATQATAGNHNGGLTSGGQRLA